MVHRNNKLPTIWDNFPALFEGIGRQKEFNDIINSANEIMDRFWNNSNLDSKFFVNNVTKPETKFPKVNLVDLGDSFKVDIAVAGFNKEDVELEFKDNALYIKAAKSSENEEEDGNYVMREISQRSFRRYIPFPEKVDKDNLSDDCVSYKDGMISCTFKKETVKKDEALKLNIS